MTKRTDRGILSDLALGKLSPEESLRVIEELEHDPEASKELDFRSALLNFAAEEGLGALEEVRRAPRPVRFRIPGGISALLARKRYLLPVGAVAGLAMAVMILFCASVATTGKFSTLAYVEAPTFDHRVRSSTQLDVGAVNQLCGEERYDEALRLLDRFIRAYPQSEWVAYAHYSAGLVYLHIAHRSTFGLFPSYDPVHVAAGLDHLEISATISPNVRLVEESCWLRAKGFLMLERPNEALLELQKMELLDGSLKTEAADLIRKIQARG